MNYHNYHFTFSILNITESRNVGLVIRPGYYQLKLGFFSLTFHDKPDL